MSRFAALFVFCAASAVAAPVPKELKKKPVLDGTWQVVECSYHAEKDGQTPYNVWTLRGEEMAALHVKDADELRGYEDDNKPYAYTFTLRLPNPDDPTVFDATSRSTGKVHRGRLALDGDSLKVCYNSDPNDERPAACERGPGMIYHSFKRIDPTVLTPKAPAK